MAVRPSQSSEYEKESRHVEVKRGRGPWLQIVVVRGLTGRQDFGAQASPPLASCRSNSETSVLLFDLES